MTKCPSTTDVAVNCGTRERRVSIQYFSYALYGRVFPFAVSSFQFSCTFHLVQFTVSGKRGRTTFKFSLSLSFSLIKLPSLCCQVQQLTTFMSVQQQQQQQPAEYLKFMLLFQSCQMLPPCAKFHSFRYRI